MRIDVPLVFSASLGAAAAAGVPRNALQPAASRLDSIQTLRDEITRLQDALRAAFSNLANLYNLGQPTHSPSSGQTTTDQASTSTTTTPLIPEVAISISIGPDLTSTLSTSSSTPTSSLDDLTSSISSAISAQFTSTATVSPVASSSVSAAPTAPANTTSAGNFTTAATMSCASLCSSLSFPNSDFPVSPVSCVSYNANDAITITGGQAEATCGTSFDAPVDLCRVVLTVQTSGESETYMEVWLPENDQWNGRTLNTDNGGVNGCVHYVDMQYVAGRGFAAIGDNAGHNGSSFDGSWFQDSNEVVLDWVYRARHSAVVAGKEVVNEFYDQAPEYSYYLGCSAGGAQGMKSAQMYPDDFDGIISGSAAADFNHLQAWSGRFVQLTGTGTTDPRFLTLNDWITVQAAIFDQCDERLDGVNDGILEDPTICQFDSTVLACSNNATLAGCLTDTQVNTVNEVFTELYNSEGELLYPALLYGSQVDAFRLGQLSGSVQAISSDWYEYAVVNGSQPGWDAIADLGQDEYALADELDEYHGYVSQFSGDLSEFRSSGGKLLMYHGLADPLVSGGNSQRYYLKVANELGLSNTQIDDFFRLYRISGMAHCGVGGISGAGAWMFGQNSAASSATHNIIDYLQQWVEDNDAPDTIVGTKYWYDTPSLGIQFERAHCRFPYRTTYIGGGADSTQVDSWTCELIENWQECGPGSLPRLCNVDGTFT